MNTFEHHIPRLLCSLLAAALLWTASSPVWAQECEPLTEAEFVDRIHASYDAIERADVAGHQAVIRDLEARIPCMEFVPDPHAWARLLVGIALVNYATGKEWEPYLTTAAWAEPRVLLDLPTGPSHAFWTWVPKPAPDPTDRPIPDGVRLYMDGLLIEKEPVVTGIHLLQRRTGDGWENLLLVDEPIPERWLKEPTLLARQGAYGEWFAGAGPNVGLAALASTDADDFYKGRTALSGGVALHADVKGAPGIPLGLQARVWIPTFGPRRGGAMDVGFFWRASILDIHMGASARGLEAAGEAVRGIGLGGHLGAELHAGEARLAVFANAGRGWGGVSASFVHNLGPVHLGAWASRIHSAWVTARGDATIPASTTVIGLSAGFGGRS